MSNLIIPGNVKQQVIPFVLDPDNPLHSQDDTAGTPQYFTFKDKTIENYGTTNNGILNIVPSTYKKYMASDLSHKLLYGKDGLKTGKQITYQEIFNSLPKIQIREFIPDSKLDQCINFFADVIKGFANLFTVPKKSSESDSSKDTQNGTTTTNAAKKNSDNKSVFKKVICTIWYVVEYILGIGDHGTLVGDMFKDPEGSSKYQKIYQTSADKANRNVKITDFPFAFYYRMQSCTTTAIYELPGIINSKILYSSNGTKGWTGGSSGFQASDHDLIGKNKILNFLFGNIGIAWSPWWDPKTGIQTANGEVVIDVNLFNDTADAAMQNFIFVNTLIPNNMWIQYGIFQHSSAIYDVKLEGYGRLFFCTGDFEVKMEGVLRDPPESWIDDLINLHANSKFGAINPENLKNVIKNRKAIKIPDIYHVTLTFTSQLPQNFNTWLFNYSHNFDNFSEYSDGNHYDPSFISQVLPNALQGLTTNVQNYWNNYKDGDEKDLAIVKSYSKAQDLISNL